MSLQAQALQAVLSRYEAKLLELGPVAQALIERSLGIVDSIWMLEMVIPAGARVRTKIDVPKDVIFFEQGYEFEVDRLDVIRFSHWHDNRLIMKDIVLGESFLSFRYTRPEICLHDYDVELVNTDTVDHKIRVYGLYKAVPRELLRGVL